MGNLTPPLQFEFASTCLLYFYTQMPKNKLRFWQQCKHRRTPLLWSLPMMSSSRDVDPSKWQHGNDRRGKIICTHQHHPLHLSFLRRTFSTIQEVDNEPPHTSSLSQSRDLQLSGLNNQPNKNHEAICIYLTLRHLIYLAMQCKYYCRVESFASSERSW